MKFFHISDLHIGKKVQGESMIKEQAFILSEIIQMTTIEEPDAVVIAGDIYDKSVPSAEAVMLLDDFLFKLVERNMQILLISGNHDSPERLYFGKKIFEKNNIHIGSLINGADHQVILDKVTLEDEYGLVHMYLMPFVKPAMIQPFYEEPLETYEDAVRKVIEDQTIDICQRNVIIAHQFVTLNGMQPDRSESEQISLGGIDCVDAAVFNAFDYVALGHIHRPQKIGKVTTRYAGSPLKYSFSEVNHKKAITCVTLKEKGTVEIRKLPLKQQRDFVVLKDTLDELLSDKYIQYRSGYYLSITITDNRQIIDPIGRIRAMFEGVLEFHIEYTIGKSYEQAKITSADLIKKTPFQLFEDFFKEQNQDEMSQLEGRIMQELLENCQIDIT